MMTAEMNPVRSPKMMKYAVEFMCVLFAVFAILSCRQAMVHADVEVMKDLFLAVAVATPATTLYFMLNEFFFADEERA